MGNIKVITKEYGSKSEAASKILSMTDKDVIPHLLYLVDFLCRTESVNFYVKYIRKLPTNNNVATITDPDFKPSRQRTIRIYLNFEEKTFKVSGDRFNNDDFSKLSNFKNHVSEHCGDQERIAICDGIIRYTEMLQDELYEIEMMDNKIDIFKRTKAKREVIVEKSESDASEGEN